MDCGFCLLKGLIGMYEIGIYGSALVKKCRYWLLVINENQTNAHFEKKVIGDHDCLSGN